MNEPIQPPAGDPKRQATDTYRGFLYQAWQAADAWIRLRPNDVLFLEHAEDYDVAMENGHVESVQVKSEAGKLSLGRAKVRDAIAQYWELKWQNPERRVSYRYLTTQERGFEQGAPFGERRGLDVWDGARRSDTDLQSLRAYLSSQELPQAVLDLLETGTDDDVREHLVMPIHWDTEAPEAQAVKQLVEERLVTYGESRALPVSPSVSRRVAASVFLRVTEQSAAEAPRRLTRADFATLFEDETTERVPAGSEAATFARLGRTPAEPPRAGSPGFLELVTGTRLPVVVEREELVASVSTRARDFSLSSIVGSTGSGKTILAELAAGKSGGWYRIDLRGHTPDVTARRLDDAALALGDLPDGSTVLLDDLSFGDGVDRIVTSLERLMTAAQQQAVHLVATSQTELPTRVVLLSPQAGEDMNLIVPMLDEPELTELVEAYRCPPALAPVWARTLLVQTSGHPQLAAALAVNARARQWPEPDVTDVVGEPAPVAEVRAEARARLRSALQSTEAFDLVQRLSVLALPFTRQQALLLAQAPPPLTMAALDLDALVGPWIEATASGRYRMSPLLKGLYRDTRPQSEHAGMHSAVADALVQDVLATRSVDSYDLSTILSQAVLGGNGPALAVGAGIAKTVTDFARIADHLDWFAVVATEDAEQPLIPSSPAASLVARELQFRVALETGRDVEPVLAAWDAEIDRVEALGMPVKGIRLLAAMSVLMNERAKVSTERLVQTARVVLDFPEDVGEDIEEVMQRAFDGVERTEDGLLGALEAGGLELARLGLTSTLVFTILCQRPKLPHEVAGLIEALVEAPAPVGPAALQAFTTDVAMTEVVVSKVYLRTRDEGGDWAEVLGMLDDLSGCSQRHALTALAVSAERERAIVLQEELGDRAAAEASLDQAEARLGEHLRLKSYRGVILRLEGEFAAALEFFEDLLPRWSEADPNTSLLYIYHSVIEAAGVVGAWDRAAYWAAQGEAEAARLGDDSYIRLCYSVDRAFSMFKAGQACDAIQLLRGVAGEIPAPTDTRLRMLHRRTTHVVAWILGELGGLRVPSLSEPAPGMASRLDSDPDEEVDLPITSGVLDAVLMEAGELAGCPSVDQEGTREDGGTQFERSIQIRRWLNEGIRDVTVDLPDRYVETIAAAEAEMKGKPLQRSSPDISGTLVALTYGIIAAVAANPPRAEVLETWAERLRSLFGESYEVEDWVRKVDTVFKATQGDTRALVELTVVARNGQANLNYRIAAAAALAKASSDSHVRVQSLAFLAAMASLHPFGMAIGAALASLGELNVPPGQGVRAVAKSVLENPELEALRLDPVMIKLLQSTVDDGPSWGLSR